jgi:hypothetical protein
MVEHYIKTAEEHLRMVVALHQRDWDARLPLFLSAYRASTHNTAGLTPASLAFERELQLPCDLLSGAPPNKERLTITHAANLVGHLHDIHNDACQHLKVASDQMKTHYDKLANCAGYHKGDKVWFYHPTWKKRKSPKLQSSWEGLYNVATRINDVVYRIQKNLRLRMVVHLDWLSLYQGAARTSGLMRGAVGAVGE